MFWRNKQTNLAWPLVFFGVIACFIFLACLILLIIFVKKAKVAEDFNSAQEKTENQVENEIQGGVPIDLGEDYRDEIIELRDYISEVEADSSLMLEKTEEKLFSIVVPKEFLDSHFKAAIAVRNLKNNSANFGEEEIRTEILNILNNIVNLF